MAKKLRVFKRIVNGKEQDNYSVRFEHKGRPYLRSTDTSVKAEAERRAKDIYELETGKAWAALRDTLRDTVAGKSEVATVDQLLKRYEEKATDVGERGNNARAFRTFLEELFPGQNVGDLRLSILTKDLVRRWESMRLERIGKEYRRYPTSRPRIQSEHSVRMTIKSTLIKVRAIFTADKLRHYEDIKLPDLAGFLNEPVQGPAPRKPQAPDEVGLQRMLRALPALKETRPAVYCAFLLMARQGLRPIEVESIRASWIRPIGGVLHVEIIDRPEENFAPKASERTIPMADDTWAELETFAHLRTAGFLIPGRTPTDRHDIVYRELSEWVSQFIRGRATATSYELRRWAGSLIMDANGGDVNAAKEFLGHASYDTTLQWYAYRIKKLQPIGMAGLLPAPLPVAETPGAPSCIAQ